jgi:hypothetical protein
MGSHRPMLPYSIKPVIISPVPASVEKAQCTDVVICSTSSPEENACIRLGFSKDAAREAARWATVIGFKAYPNRVYNSATYVTCRQVFTRVVVSVDMGDLRPHPDFVSAVQQVVKHTTHEERARCLQNILKSWGSVIPTIIELGCAVVSTILLEISDVRATLTDLL